MNKEDSIKKCKPLTLTGIPRMEMLWNAIKSIKENDIKGCFVETGVYKGGSAMLACYAFKYYGMDRGVYLFDTFTGMTRPTKEDFKIGRDKKHEDYLKKWEDNNKLTHNDWCYASYEEVNNNMNSVDYEFFDLIKGDVLDTVREKMCGKIAVLRIDLDFYKATKHVLKTWYNQVQKGGYIIFDDYLCWNGANEAVNEFLEENKISKDELITVDHSCVYMCKRRMK